MKFSFVVSSRYISVYFSHDTINGSSRASKINRENKSIDILRLHAYSAIRFLFYRVKSVDIESISLKFILSTM